LNTDVRADIELDATGLNCPMPLLKLKQQLNRMSVSQVILVKTSDAGSVRDFRAFVDQAGHTLLFQDENAGEYVFVIKKEI